MRLRFCVCVFTYIYSGCFILVVAYYLLGELQSYPSLPVKQPQHEHASIDKLQFIYLLFVYKILFSLCVRVGGGGGVGWWTVGRR